MGETLDNQGVKGFYAYLSRFSPSTYTPIRYTYPGDECGLTHPPKSDKK